MSGVDLADAIEDVARALFAERHVQEDVPHPCWGELVPGAKDAWRHIARVALAAGLPTLQQAFALLVESRVDHCYNDPMGDCARAAYRDAARAIRAPLSAHVFRDRHHTIAVTGGGQIGEAQES